MYVVKKKKKKKTKKVHKFLQIEKKKNDWCAYRKPKKIKKVRIFLQQGRKKMIDVHTVNQQK